eukprot:gnl/TRDRNA2_/TRDRNA2_60530_c0_seq1.p1 gnl/TRDRNA2_/TRDRNA2_60530_c0~~gnl/TRDRNA2_/TRDRNA2_60530_c0_seq1.p1  ORF type:complete len:315 (-),score=60.12 gnl/TRDRNA2_/TRDRNA2_60530_c0_seq1:65-1009(-)
MARVLEVCGGFLCCMVPFLIIGSLNVVFVSPLEIGLRYNYLMEYVSPEVVENPGLHYVGWVSTILTYPRTIQTLEFDADSGGLLYARTNDGLPLTLGISLQYRLFPKELYSLYRTYDAEPGDYQYVYQAVAKHLIVQTATRFTAYQFFNEKQRIADVMRDELNEFFTARMHASIESLQINEDRLPTEFTDALLTAATCKQNITRMTKIRDAQKVAFETQKLVARAQANVTMNHAKGEQHKIFQNGQADSNIIQTYVEAEVSAYTMILEKLGVEGDELIRYMWYDVLGGGGVDTKSDEEQELQLFVGVDPSAYIQ